MTRSRTGRPAHRHPALAAVRSGLAERTLRAGGTIAGTAVSTRTVEGHYRLIIDGSPVQGSLSFAAAYVLADAGNDIVLMPETIVVPLDVDGHFSVDLPVTDDPDLTPINWAYLVVERFTNTNGRDPYYITVPYDGGATTALSIMQLRATAPNVNLGSDRMVTEAELESRFNYRGDYAAGAAYAPNDVVRYNSELWYTEATFVGGAVFDTNLWAIFGGGGGGSGSSGQPRWTGEGPPGTITGASPGDVYLDELTGTLYTLE